MKFFAYTDLIDTIRDFSNTTMVNYDQITYIKILDKLPYFTVYFSNEKFIEIDKMHLKRFLEEMK